MKKKHILILSLFSSMVFANKDLKPRFDGDVIILQAGATACGAVKIVNKLPRAVKLDGSVGAQGAVDTRIYRKGFDGDAIHIKYDGLGAEKQWFITCYVQEKRKPKPCPYTEEEKVRCGAWNRMEAKKPLIRDVRIPCDKAVSLQNIETGACKKIKGSYAPFAFVRHFRARFRPGTIK